MVKAKQDNHSKVLLKQLKEIRKSLQFLASQMSYLVMRNYIQDSEEQASQEFIEKGKDIQSSYNLIDRKNYIG